jgi:hypothetical protein
MEARNARLIKMKQKTNFLSAILIVLIAAFFASIYLPPSLLGLGNTCPAVFGCHSGPDVIRISDLQQLRTGLDLYFRKCGIYPGGALAPGSDPRCAGVSRPRQLIGPMLGISRIPTDPQTGTAYSYCHTAGGASYVLQAKLQDTSNSALTNSLAVSPSGCVDTEGVVTCDRQTGEYCVSP